MTSFSSISLSDRIQQNRSSLSVFSENKNYVLICLLPGMTYNCESTASIKGVCVEAVAKH
jgi:hypothetical protein